jgi:hypothetical protein
MTHHKVYVTAPSRAERQRPRLPSAASLELGQGLVNVVVPLDPEDSPVTDHVNDAYGRRHGFRTARGSPGVDAQANEDKLTTLSYLLDLDGRRASGSVEEVLKGCPHPSEACARAPFDRVTMW